MEWKSTNISKKEFEQKQKEFMREAMDMSKRARPAAAEQQNIPAAVNTEIPAVQTMEQIAPKPAEEISEPAVSTENAEAPDESISVQSENTAVEDIPVTTAEEGPAVQVSAPIEENAADDEEAVQVSAPVEENAADDEETMQVSAPIEENAADDEEVVQIISDAVSDDAEEVFAQKDEEHEAEDYMSFFESDKSDNNNSCKVPDFAELIKNHNSSTETECQNCQETRQHEEDG